MAPALHGGAGAGLITAAQHGVMGLTRSAALAEESVAAQKAIEAADTLPFEEWRQHYMAAQGLG